MTIQEFNEKYAEVAKRENYVPRNYETIGGMWTADTYKLNHWTARLEDEGYTKILIDHANKKMYRLNFKNEISEKSLTG